MSFTMIHLIIADNISTAVSHRIENLPQFFLGSIAPDAIHNRENYSSDLKKGTHLCVGPENWGRITNNDEWKDNAMAFLHAYRGSALQDFITGYGIHILTDIYNNQNVWNPFMRQYPDEIEKGYAGLLHQEDNKLDIALAQTFEKRDHLWSCLAKSQGVDLGDLLSASEMEQQKTNILNLLYKDKEPQDITSNVLATYESTMAFIDEATAALLPVICAYLDIAL